MLNKKIAILAGGFGTRLKAVAKDMPKSMVDIERKPFLEHQLYILKKAGFSKIVLCTGYMSEKIKSYFGTGDKFGLSIEYSDENKPLGTAGALRNAKDLLGDTFFALNGDTFIDIDFSNFFCLHKESKSIFSVALSQIEDAADYGTVRVDNKNRIVSFDEKRNKKKGNLVNMGIYIVEPAIFDYIPDATDFLIEEDLISRLISEKANCYGFLIQGYFMDIGTPKRLELFRNKIKEKKKC